MLPVCGIFFAVVCSGYLWLGYVSLTFNIFLTAAKKHKKTFGKLLENVCLLNLRRETGLLDFESVCRWTRIIYHLAPVQTSHDLTTMAMMAIYGLCESDSLKFSAVSA